MRKILIVCGVLVAALGFASGAAAHCGSCEGDHAAKAESADSKQGSCPFEAAKAEHDKVLAETGCEKSAKAAYNNKLAEGSYAKALTETGCSKTANKAAYDAVLEKCGCKKTAATAAQHAMAQAAYNETLEKTGCAETAKKAYEEAVKQASDQIEPEIESETSKS